MEDITERLLANIPTMLKNNSFKFIPKINSPNKANQKIGIGLGVGGGTNSSNDSPSPPRFPEVTDKKFDNRDVSPDESITIKKQDGLDSIRSKNSSRMDNESKLPAINNIKMTINSDDLQSSPKDKKTLGYEGIGGDSVMYLHG